MTTKLKKTFIFVLAIGFSGTLFAQEHLAESKSLVGMWRQTIVEKNNKGEIVKEKLPNFKVINADGTFYTFTALNTGNINTPETDVSIYMYGTYDITSDSTFTEHVIKNYSVPDFDKSNAELRYKFVPDSDNNLVYMIWKSTVNNEWIPEAWERVGFFKKEEETRTL